MNRKAQITDAPAKVIRKLDPLRPAAEQISASLKESILNMSLVPGQIVSETEIGHLFGASRTPVREAFTWLRERGLIVTYPSRGNYVAKLSIPELKGAQFVRESLEMSVALLLCHTGLNDETIQRIELNLDAQQAFIKTGNGPTFHQLDDEFHLALLEAAEHARLSEIIQREKANLDRLRVLTLNSSSHMEILFEEHRAIFEAIRSGNKAATQRVMRKHLRRVLETLSDLFNAHRDYFVDFDE